jgi:hypothetical protein
MNHGGYALKEKGMVVTVTCKRCDVQMTKWKRSAEDESQTPFPFDRICGRYITQKEVWNAYPLFRGTYLKK